MRTTEACRLLSIVLVLLLCGCARDYAYRSDLRPCTADRGAPAELCGESALVTGENGNLLGFVEFDDQGQLRDPLQMAFVLNHFREIAQRQDVVIVTFVHGWHHNASERDENVRQFSGLLERIGNVEAQGAHRKVLGLYIGWRGESVTVEGVNMLTFWDRKNTAQKVGGYGLVELLLKLEEIVNVKEGEVRGNSSRLVIAGHSFGGAVVYTAVQQILEDRFIDSRRGKTVSDNAKGFADLVVLLNPAFEALRYASLYNLSQERCFYFDNQQPKLLILTSEADWATGFFFPLGRFFSTTFETYDDIEGRGICAAGGRQSQIVDEGEADLDTVGHFEPYLTHRLDKSREKRQIDLRTLPAAWAEQSYGNEFAFSGVTLKHFGRTHPLNPYLNVVVDSKLIPGHNEIWGDEVLDFLRDFIAIAITPATQKQ